MLDGAEWQVYSPSSEGTAFSSESRDDAEKWLQRIPGDYVLRRQHIRTRSERWFEEPETVPWHSRCSWVSGIDEPRDRAVCIPHGGHRQHEPVPEEFWRGLTAPAHPDEPASVTENARTLTPDTPHHDA